MSESYTYSGSESRNLIKEGSYEVIINEIIKGYKGDGRKYLQVNFKFRDDVEQNYKNMVFRDFIQQSKENPNAYVSWKIDRLMNALEVPKGTTFATYDEVIKFLTGKKVLIGIKTEFDSFANEERNVISWVGKTKAPTQTLGSNQQEEPVLEGVVNDEDLPF